MEQNPSKIEREFSTFQGSTVTTKLQVTDQQPPFELPHSSALAEAVLLRSEGQARIRAAGNVQSVKEDTYNIFQTEIHKVSQIR